MSSFDKWVPDITFLSDNVRCLTAISIPDFGQLNFIELAALQPQLTHLQSQPSDIGFTMGTKVWISFSWITFQYLCQEIAKKYCIALSVHNLSFCNIFHLVQNEIHNEVNRCNSLGHKERKITRHTRFSGTGFDEYRLFVQQKTYFFPLWKSLLNMPKICPEISQIFCYKVFIWYKSISKTVALTKNPLQSY